MEPLPDIVRQFVSEARVCRIATLRPTGEPHVIPVCPVFDGDATVYVDIGKRYATAEGLQTNQNIAVLMDEYFDDWSKLKGVLLRCRAEAAVGGEQASAWEMIRRKFPQYEPIGWSPRLTLALRIYDWRQWGNSEGPREEAE